VEHGITVFTRVMNEEALWLLLHVVMFVIQKMISWIVEQFFFNLNFTRKVS
jgi:hypothetical protein